MLLLLQRMMVSLVLSLLTNLIFLLWQVVAAYTLVSVVLVVEAELLVQVVAQVVEISFVLLRPPVLLSLQQMRFADHALRFQDHIPLHQFLDNCLLS